MIVKFAVLNYKSTGDGTWSGSADTLTDVYDVGVILNIGDKNDTFVFKTQNYRNTKLKADVAGVRQADFRAPDNVNIHYLINGDSVASSNLIMNGLIKRPSETLAGKGRMIKVAGVSFSEIATTGLCFVDATNVNVMEFLAQAINSIALRNTNFGVSWDLPASKFNPITGLYDGDSFPLVNGGASIKEFDKSLNALLDKYLQEAYTGDGRYFWYINNTKTLVARKRSVGVFTGTLTEGEDFKTVKYDINTDDVKNFIIVKAGLDAYNKPITTRYDDPASRAKFGFKYYMLIDTKISGDLLSAEGLASSSKFPDSYPHTTSWGVSTNSDDSFNTALRTQAKIIGVNKGEAFATAHNKGFKKVTVSKKPTLNHGVGDRIKITSPSYGLTEEAMRITSVSYFTNSVELMLEEEVAVAK